MPSPSVWTFTPHDIRAAAVGWANASADVPTCLVVQGSVPRLPDGGDGGGIVTTITDLEIVEPYALKGASFVTVVFAEGLIPVSGAGDKPVELQVVQRIRTTITKKDGCIQRTLVETFEPFRAEAARYSQQAAGGRQQIAGVYVDADGTVGGTERAYVDQFESLQLIRAVLTTPQYTGPEGELEFLKVQTGQWFNPPAALFVDSGTLPLTRLTVFTLGSGAGVQIRQQEFFGGPDDPIVDNPDVATTLPAVDVWYQVDTADVTSVDGYETARQEAQLTFELTLAGTYVYTPDDTRRSLFPEARALILAERDTIRSIIRGEEGSHVLVVSETERDFLTRVRTETLDQYLPATEACNLELALRNSSAPFAAVVCAGESSRRPVIQIIDSNYVETIDEAAALGIQELRELQAVEISLPIPPNATLLAGDHVTVDVPQRGYPGTSAWIDTVGHTQAERADGEGTPPVLGTVLLKESQF